MGVHIRVAAVKFNTFRCRTLPHCRRSATHCCTAALPHLMPHTTPRTLCRTHRLPRCRILHTTAHCRSATHCCTQIVTAVTATYGMSMRSPTAALPRTAAHSLSHTAALFQSRIHLRNARHLIWWTVFRETRSRDLRTQRSHSASPRSRVDP
jgi:hypothetical protein